MLHDAGLFVLVIGENGATIQTGWVGARMTRGRYGLLEGMTPVLTEEEPYFTPGFTLVEAVETVAGADTCFTAGAFVQVHFESVLVTGRRFSKRNEVTIIFRLSGK